MDDRAKLTGDLRDVRRTTRTVGIIVWAVAIAVMVYGVPIVYSLLVDHGVPAEIAWLLSPIVDGALAVGLVATGVLARHNLTYGWVGAIRWVAGFITWALNTAGPWTHPGGIDWLGVGTHTAGPVILFFTVEAAAQFQQKMGAVIAKLEGKLAALDQSKRAEQTRLTDLTDRVNRLTADLTAAADRERRHTEEIASLKLTAESETANFTRELESVKAESETLRTALTDIEVKHSEELTRTVTELKARHTEQMARLRAEMGSVNVTNIGAARGRRRAVGGSPQAGSPKVGRATISVEDAVQKLLAENGDPDYEWSQAEVRRVTGVGFSRTKEILSALSAHHCAARSVNGGVTSGGGFGEPAGDLSGDDEEGSTDDVTVAYATA